MLVTMIDADGDGLIDTEDPCCSTASDNDEIILQNVRMVSTMMGMDGLIWQTFLWGPADLYENDGFSIHACNNNVDDDGDGLVDRDDFGCYTIDDENEVDPTRDNDGIW